MNLTPEAESLLDDLARRYAAVEYRRSWYFDKGKEGRVYNELQSLDLLKMMGTKGSAWMLTDAGHRVLMARASENPGVRCARKAFSLFRKAFNERQSPSAQPILFFNRNGDKLAESLGMQKEELGFGLEALRLANLIDGTDHVTLTEQGMRVCLRPDMLDDALGVAGARSPSALCTGTDEGAAHRIPPTPAIMTSLDRKVVESVLEMGGGYVLDFTDGTFRDFFFDFSVDIDSARFQDGGTSKARRLRSFLRQGERSLVRRVLEQLLEHRLLQDRSKPDEKEIAVYRSLLDRLARPSPESNPSSHIDAAALAKLEFRPELFRDLPIDQAVTSLLIDRMAEAKRCILAESYLAAIILSGSVLEGMCLGHGQAHPEMANRGYAEQYKKPAPKLTTWRLHEWIQVLTRLGHFTPNVSNFGHALRDFRNYVHPAEQISSKFQPDRHTAEIGFQVVLAAANDLSTISERASKRSSSDG